MYKKTKGYSKGGKKGGVKKRKSYKKMNTGGMATKGYRTGGMTKGYSKGGKKGGKG